MKKKIEFLIGIKLEPNSPGYKNLVQSKQVMYENIFRGHKFFYYKETVGNESELIQKLIGLINLINVKNIAGKIGLRIYAFDYHTFPFLYDLEKKDPALYNKLDVGFTQFKDYLKIRTELILEDNFTAIYGSPSGFYSQELVLNYAERSKNFISYLESTTGNQQESINDVKANDKALFRFMIDNEASFFGICKKHGVDVKGYVPELVDRIANVALEANHRM